MNLRVFIFLPLIWACSGENESNTESDLNENTGEEKVVDVAHDSQNSLDWAGTYKGVLPCEDCEGVETQITLKEGGQYSREEKFLGKSKTPLMGAGIYKWNEEGSEVTLKSPSGNNKTYKVVENALIFYENGKAPADPGKYRLEKNQANPALEKEKWVLTELNGKELAAFDYDQEPFLEFNSVEARISGNASCNDFFGRYELISDNRISMGERMGLTRKMCEGNTLEEVFVEALKSANQYQVSGKALTLMSEGEELAKFKAAAVDA